MENTSNSSNIDTNVPDITTNKRSLEESNSQTETLPSTLPKTKGKLHPKRTFAMRVHQNCEPPEFPFHNINAKSGNVLDEDGCIVEEHPGRLAYIYVEIRLAKEGNGKIEMKYIDYFRKYYDMTEKDLTIAASVKKHRKLAKKQ